MRWRNGVGRASASPVMALQGTGGERDGKGLGGQDMGSTIRWFSTAHESYTTTGTDLWDRDPPFYKKEIKTIR